MILALLVWAVMAVLAIWFFLAFPPIWPLVIIVLLWYGYRGWPEPDSRRMTTKEREKMGAAIFERDKNGRRLP